MANLNYTAAQINALLEKASDAPTQQEVSDEFTSVRGEISNVRGEITTTVDTAINQNVGDLSTLRTTDKDNCVDAINENFTNADEGKKAIAASLVGKGQSAADTDTWQQLSGKINNLSPQGYIDPSTALIPKILNSVTPTGTYATETYYNTDFGVQIGYAANGDVLVLMQGGTSTSYEYLRFSLASAPSGVTITEAHNTSSSYTTAATGLIYGCVLRGVPQNCNMSIDMSARDSTGDTITCAITITKV